MIHHLEGVFHVSEDEGIIGNLFLTNIRVVWHSALDALFNCSISYLEMVQIQIKDSKYGQTLVLESKGRKTMFMYGFRIDPREKLVMITKQIRNLWKLYQEKPIFGVDLEQEEEDLEKKQDPNSTQQILFQESEEIDIVYESQSHLKSHQSIAIPLKDASSMVYNEYLGLAIQPTLSGQTIPQLWTHF